MKRKKIIRTKNREIYEKFSMLHFAPEIVLVNTSKKQLGRILSSINCDQKVLESSNIDNYFLIRKKRPVNFVVYLR